MVTRSSFAGPLLRGPGRFVPGWFPLVVERLRGLSDEPSGPVVAEIQGSRMVLDLDDYVQRKIWYGCFEPAQVRVAARRIRKGDTVMDVGANVGFYTLLFARLVGPTGTVHAFEPVLGDVLEGNLELNDYRNVVVHRTAVGAEHARLMLTNPRAGDSTGNWQRSGGSEGREVPQVTLDEYVEERVAFVKVDVEGMEADVLAGLSHSLAAGRVDALMVEMAGDLLDEPAPVTEPLLEAGYEVRRIGEFGRLHGLGRPSHITRIVGLYYLLAFRPRVAGRLGHPEARHRRMTLV
jgi:FkbM family methyltransferase